MPQFDLTPDTPANIVTPATGYYAIFLNSSDSDLAYKKNSAGVSSSLVAGFANPMTSVGDTIYGGALGVATRLAAGSNGQVLTLAAGIPSWATPTAGTVTSVSGTASRVTSTGGATPVIDISATFEALLEKIANKDATGGYAGLTLFKINFKNAANTFTSFFTNANTAARTYTFQNRDGTISDDTDLALKLNKASVPCEFIVACSDLTTALTTGTTKAYFRAPYAFTLTAVRASLGTAQTSGSIFTVDINESGTSVLSTKLTIDNTETTSTTAATPPVISDSAIADDAIIAIDIDQVGDGTAKGLIVTLIGTHAV